MNFGPTFCLIFSLCLCSKTCGTKLFTKRITFDNMNGLMSAFTDFDFNRVTDLFLITENGRSIELAEGLEIEPYLQKWPNIKCTFANTSGDRIVGAIPADFIGEAQIDLLVVTQDIYLSHLRPNDRYFKLWLFTGNDKNLRCNTSVPLIQNIRSFPMTLDFNGDMITDFIVETDDCPKELWVLGRPTCLEQIRSNQAMNYPNSNAFIDLSNPKDFYPDLYFSGTDSIEYWFNIKGFESLNKLNINYPNKEVYQYLGQSVFVDINFDGIVEHILPVCKSSVETCEEPQILVLTLREHKYEWIEILNSNTLSKLTFTQIKLFDYLDLFVTLRAGDIDADGFPDFVTVMREQNSSKTRAVWLRNTYTKSNKFGREFVIEWTSDDDRVFGDRNDSNVNLATVFDIEEDGKLDILIGSHDSNNTLTLSAFINSGKSSSNFIKVLVSSGICKSNCPQISTSLIGPYICYSPSEGNNVGCAGQLSQSAHHSLQLPFVLFGLGEIPNYVENLTVSIPSGQMKARQQTWFELIPGATVIIIPYPPNDTDNWVQKLYLNPKYFAFQTLISLTTICCFLIIIIGVLHKRDLRRDVREHKEYKKHWL